MSYLKVLYVILRETNRHLNSSIVIVILLETNRNIEVTIVGPTETCRHFPIPFVLCISQFTDHRSHVDLCSYLCLIFMRSHWYLKGLSLDTSGVSVIYYQVWICVSLLLFNCDSVRFMDHLSVFRLTFHFRFRVSSR